MCSYSDQQLANLRQMYDDDDNELEIQSELYLTPGQLSHSSSWSSCLSSLEHCSEECLVCLENEMLELGYRPCCNQPVCRTCLERHIRSKLEIGVVHIVCPNPACDELLRVEELTKLGAELAHIYYRRLVDVNSDPHHKTCPNCWLITDVDPSWLNDNEASKYGLEINCIECQFQWCFRCHGPNHPQITCDKNSASDDLLQKWAKRKRKVPRAQQCPICKIYVERTEGCPHMQCRLCQSEFCYYCGDYWHDLHLQFCIKSVDETGKSRRRRRLRRKFRKAGIIGGAVVGGVIAVPIIVGVLLPVAAVVLSVCVSFRIVRHVKRALR